MDKEYTIKEALIELGITSKSTLYYRMNKFNQELTKHISIKEGKKYISHIGIEILKSRDMSDYSSDSHSNNSSDSSNYCSNEEHITVPNTCEVLMKENDFLKNQILEKDSQIQTLSKLIENSQVLLKQEQQARLLLLPVKENKFIILLKKFLKPKL